MTWSTGTERFISGLNLYIQSEGGKPMSLNNW